MKYLLLVCLAISVMFVPQLHHNKVFHLTSTADMDFETINHLVIDCNIAEKQYKWLEEQRSSKVDKLTPAVYNNTRAGQIHASSLERRNGHIQQGVECEMQQF